MSSSPIGPLFDSPRLVKLDPAVVDQVPIDAFNALIDVVNAINETVDALGAMIVETESE